MTSASTETLIITDLEEVVETVAQALQKENQVSSIASLSGLGGIAMPTGMVGPLDRWTPVFEAALQGSQETLPVLLQNIRKRLGESPKSRLDKALREMRDSCISRVARTAHREFDNQIDALMAAESAQKMVQPARDIRDTALGVRRLLMRPLLAETFLRLEQELGASFPDPEWLRMQLADQAVDVVNAVDYLLNLLFTPSATSAPLALSAEAGTDRTQGRTDAETLDWLTRRRLDARGTAVRSSMRLLVALRRDIS